MKNIKIALSGLALLISGCATPQRLDIETAHKNCMYDKTRKYANIPKEKRITMDGVYETPESECSPVPDKYYYKNFYSRILDISL